MFTPETYEVVAAKSIIGVRENVKKSFTEKMKPGDMFIVYISRKMVFDGFGVISGEVTFEKSKIFHAEKNFPYRRQVVFEKMGLNKHSGSLFGEIAPFDKVNTGPGNYLMVKGGFVEVSKVDFYWLLDKIQD